MRAFDGKNLLEYGLEPLRFFLGRVRLQEPIIGLKLHLDKVWEVQFGFDFPEIYDFFHFLHVG